MVQTNTSEVTSIKKKYRYETQIMGYTEFQGPICFVAFTQAFLIHLCFGFFWLMFLRHCVKDLQFARVTS